MSDGPEQLNLAVSEGRIVVRERTPINGGGPGPMAIAGVRRTSHEGDVSTLIANAHELGRGHGYEAGLAEGYEIAREHLIDRIALQLEQRSGSPRDVGGSVLREALQRMQASRKDIDPTHH